MFETDPNNRGRIAISFKNFLILFTLLFVMGGAIHLSSLEPGHHARAASAGEVSQ